MLRKSTPKGIAFGADLDQKRRTWRCLSASSSTCDPANLRGSSPWTLGATPIYQGDCLPDRYVVRVVGMENIHIRALLRHLTKVTCYSIYSGPIEHSAYTSKNKHSESTGRH